MKKIVVVTFLILLSNISYTQEDNECKVKPFEAYIDDGDKFSNIRESPAGEIILKINNKYSYGYIINIIDFKDGWFKINKIEGIDAYDVENFEGWVHSSIVGAFATYDLNLVQKPNGKVQTGKIKGQNGHSFKIIDMHCEWIKIKFGELVGWVKSEKICGSPVTNCS